MTDSGNPKTKKRSSKNYKNSSPQNPLKHGLTAMQPPTLLSEDKEVYGRMLQDLTEEYQPATPTESLYVEKVAMGQLRLYRLWRTEAARANKDMVQHRYPSLNKGGGYCETWEFGALPKEISKEKSALALLIKNLASDLDSKQMKLISEDKTLSDILGSVTSTEGATYGSSVFESECYGLRDIRCGETQAVIRYLRAWLTPPKDDVGEEDEEDEEGEEEEKYIKPDHVEFNVAISKASQLLALLQKRLQEVESEQKAFVQNHENSKGIVQDPELLSRYERHINRQLKDDIEMLKTLRDSRQAT